MKIDLRAKITTSENGGLVRVRRVSKTQWQELGLYLEVVAFIAGNAIDEGNPNNITNRGDMIQYIADYISKAMPDYERIR